MPDPIVVTLTSDEALVLFEWLARTSDAGQPAPFVDQAEQRVLWDVESRLESSLGTLVASDYKEVLGVARGRTRDRV